MYKTVIFILAAVALSSCSDLGERDLDNGHLPTLDPHASVNPNATKTFTTDETGVTPRARDAPLAPRQLNGGDDLSSICSGYCEDYYCENVWADTCPIPIFTNAPAGPTLTITTALSFCVGDGY